MFLLTSPVAVFAYPFGFANETAVSNSQETINLVVVINGGSYAIMKNVPNIGCLEVYTILGERIKQVSLKNNGERVNIELSKGLYILRVGKVTQKIIVR